MSADVTILQGDAVEMLRTLADGSVQCVVTSPPYWGLRDYGADGQIGLESDFDEYLERVVLVFDEVYRVLKADGVLWLNMGDSYAGSTKGGANYPDANWPKQLSNQTGSKKLPVAKVALKPKNLIGQPWRLAFALQSRGWILRSDIIWAKPNPMPESVTDRPTRSHEYLFLLTKSGRYYYDAEAIRNPPSEAMLKEIEEGYNGSATKDYAGAGVQNPSDVKSRIIAGKRKLKTPSGWDTEPGAHGNIHRTGRSDKQRGHGRRHDGFNDRWDQMEREEQCACGSNARTVWTIAPTGFPGAHFATFPEELPRRCILAGSQSGDVVLDPFGGSGTTAAVAFGLGRKAVTIELNPDYVKICKDRCGLFAEVKKGGF